MVLDCNKYRLNIPRIKRLIENKTEAEVLKYISTLSSATGVHIIIICHYIGEIYGFSEELNEYIEMLKKFYVVSDIINVRNE